MRAKKILNYSILVVITIVAAVLVYIEDQTMFCSDTFMHFVTAVLVVDMIQIARCIKLFIFG